MRPSAHRPSAGAPHAVLACGSRVLFSRFAGAPGSPLVHEPGSWVFFSSGAPHADFACGSWGHPPICSAGFYASAFGVRRLAAAFTASARQLPSFRAKRGIPLTSRTPQSLSSRAEWPVPSSAPLSGAPATQRRNLLLAFPFSIFHFLFSIFFPPSPVGAFSLYTN